MKVPCGEHVSVRSNPYLTRRRSEGRGIAADREDLINGVLVAAIVILLVAAIVILPPPFLPFAILFLPLIGATVIFALLFLPWKRIAHSPLPPEALQRHIVFQLRRQGFRVEEGPEGTKVRLGSMAALRFRVSGAPGGSEVRYQPYATPSGWGTLITLIVLVWTSVVGAVAAVYVHRKARRFAHERLGALVEAVDSLPPPPADDIRVLLVHGLSEGHRLASDAYEAQRSDLGDVMAIVAVAGLALFVLTFIGLFFGLPQGSPWREGATPFEVSVLLGVGVTVGLEWAVWHRVRPRLLACRGWAERLRLALLRETASQAPGPAEPSNVELLIGLSQEIPGWLRIRRWAGLSGDQAAGWVVFLLSVGAFWALWMAVNFALAGGFLYALVAGALGTGLAVAAYVYWARWRVKEEVAIDRTLEEWRQRTESLRMRLDQFLQGL